MSLFSVYKSRRVSVEIKVTNGARLDKTYLHYYNKDSEHYYFNTPCSHLGAVVEKLR